MVHSGRRLKNEEICTAQILHGFHLGVVVGLQRRGGGRRSSRSLSVWRRGRGEGRNKFIYPNKQANKQTNKQTSRFQTQLLRQVRPCRPCCPQRCVQAY